jgi:hypothetical protein
MEAVLRRCGISMGRAVTILIDRELISVLGDTSSDESPVFAQQASEHIANREAESVAREREVDKKETRMREWSEQVRRFGQIVRRTWLGVEWLRCESWGCRLWL